ncbi:hypothetical protein M422DRAFT_72238 [Sphaerobolus stellatus SS14]|uniref:Uncharacterized protein n=1 Tax=Sphaerobolus stellatus (strain SS14) TaxID=990650 RepID=A0A0C9TTJ8_SPHS4|nr:hypothetical protein M422DRAFT_72238 [Sphaerobolus stellatus SS14]
MEPEDAVAPISPPIPTPSFLLPPLLSTKRRVSVVPPTSFTSVLASENKAERLAAEKELMAMMDPPSEVGSPDRLTNPSRRSKNSRGWAEQNFEEADARIVS